MCVYSCVKQDQTLSNLTQWYSLKALVTSIIRWRDMNKVVCDKTDLSTILHTCAHACEYAKPLGARSIIISRRLHVRRSPLFFYANSVGEKRTTAYAKTQLKVAHAIHMEDVKPEESEAVTKEIYTTVPWLDWWPKERSKCPLRNTEWTKVGRGRILLFPF